MNYSAKIKQVYITISDALKEVKVWIWHLTVDHIDIAERHIDDKSLCDDKASHSKTLCKKTVSWQQIAVLFSL